MSRDADLWAGVDRLVARSPRSADLRYHGLDSIAAAATPRPARPDMTTRAARRTAAATSLIAPLVLQRVLAAVDQRVLLMKGPEVAAHYPDPLGRRYRDLDLLVPDAAAAWESLVDAGFEPTGDPALYVGIHHLRPLLAPGLPLMVEIHHEPKWLDGRTPPTGELLETAVPSATGIPGLWTLERTRHAVAVAVHAWAHTPLGHLGRLLDVAALAQGLERSLLQQVARSWGVERLWTTTQHAIDSLFHDARRPLAGRVWARHLWSARERTVLERHLQNWLAPFAAAPAPDAARATGTWLLTQLTPAPGETRADQLRRATVAARDAFKRVSEHDAGVDRSQP